MKLICRETNPYGHQCIAAEYKIKVSVLSEKYTQIRVCLAIIEHKVIPSKPSYLAKCGPCL